MSFNNLRPSKIRHYETKMDNIEVNIDFFNSAMIMCLSTYHDTGTLIDEVWVTGIQLRTAFGLLPILQQDTIINLNTAASICFMNGVNGDDWNHDPHK
jgi:hypothetical protein